MLKNLWAPTYQPTGCFRFFDRVSEPIDLLPTGGAHRYYNGYLGLSEINTEF